MYTNKLTLGVKQLGTLPRGTKILLGDHEGVWIVTNDTCHENDTVVCNVDTGELETLQNSTPAAPVNQ